MAVAPNPARAITRSFVRRVGNAETAGTKPPTGLRRRVVLSTIFRVMPRQVDRRRAEREDGVVEWRIGDGEGGVDIWRMTIADGSVRVRRGGAERPRTRIEASTGDFLALVTGNADGLGLWRSGRLVIEGDLWFAATLASLFRVPRSSRRDQ